jgi:hypothetical protein
MGLIFLSCKSWRFLFGNIVRSLLRTTSLSPCLRLYSHDDCIRSRRLRARYGCSSRLRLMFAGDRQLAAGVEGCSIDLGSAQLIAPSNLTTSDINIFLHATYPIHWRMPSDWLPLWQSGGNVTIHRQKEGDDDARLQYIGIRELHFLAARFAIHKYAKQQNTFSWTALNSRPCTCAKYPLMCSGGSHPDAVARSFSRVGG